MRILTMLVGLILAVLGVFSVANAGLTFISMAFIIGIALIFVGIIECFSYKRSVENDEEKHWVLCEGLTAFILGIIVLAGQLSAENAVPVVFGMWIMISGIRGLVVGTQVEAAKSDDKFGFFWNLIVSLLSLTFGLYTFFNPMLFRLSLLFMLGICFVIQGLNVVKIGYEMTYVKPEFLKTKDERIADAEEEADVAHQEAKKAIKKAKKAKQAVKEAEESQAFEEIIENIEQKVYNKNQSAEEDKDE